MTQIDTPTLAAYGFEHSEMGGNCTAYVRDNGDTETLITDGDGAAPMTMDEPVVVCEMSKEHGDPVSWQEYSSVMEYLTAAAA